MRPVWPLFSSRTRIPVNAGPFNDGVAAYRRGDSAKALRLLRLLAEHGDCGAQNNLAIILKWLRSAAEQGHAEAQYNLGIVYYKGWGVPQDDAEAVTWYRKAAEQGYASAQFILGLMYGLGKVVPKDYVSAHTWLNLAAAQGNDKAQKCRDRTAKRMTPDQIAEAHRLAREWMAIHQQ